MRHASAALAVALAFGCSGGPGKPIDVPSISPDSAASAAMKDYDSNQDGALDAKELAAGPGLRAGLVNLDSDRDGKLSRQELVAGLEAIKASNIGLTSFTCTVLLDNEPLEGATVTLIPESFMGSAFKPATAVTGPDGSASPRTEGSDVPAAQCGYYRVQVSKKDGSGQETILPKYNAATTLGVEVAPGGRGASILRLSRR